jgi:glucose-1-phosphatase
MAEAKAVTVEGGLSGIRLIISDFGGVICTFEYRIFCERLAHRIHRRAEEIFVAAFGDHLQEDFETGRLTGPEYHQTVMARLDAEVPYEEFYPMYGNIFTENQATCDLLQRLCTRYPLYLLSDTNEIHFGYVRKTVAALSLFKEFIVSYQVGVMKPDPRIYQEALRRSGLPARACLFVDDRPANVQGAARLGIHAVQFGSPPQFADDLRRLGVVIP